MKGSMKWCFRHKKAPCTMRIMRLSMCTGTSARTRTGTPRSNGFWIRRVYQFHHTGTLRGELYRVHLKRQRLGGYLSGNWTIIKNYNPSGKFAALYWGQPLALMLDKETRKTPVLEQSILLLWPAKLPRPWVYHQETPSRSHASFRF